MATYRLVRAGKFVGTYRRLCSPQRRQLIHASARVIRRRCAERKIRSSIAGGAVRRATPWMRRMMLNRGSTVVKDLIAQSSPIARRYAVVISSDVHRRVLKSGNVRTVKRRAAIRANASGVVSNPSVTADDAVNRAAVTVVLTLRRANNALSAEPSFVNRAAVRHADHALPRFRAVRREISAAHRPGNGARAVTNSLAPKCRRSTLCSIDSISPNSVPSVTLRQPMPRWGQRGLRGAMRDLASE